MRKSLLLSRTYFPRRQDNRMSLEGDVATARQNYLNDEPSNLQFLLEKRYQWMNEYITATERGIEIGCGTGLSKLFVRGDYLLTDVNKNSWVDMVVDALEMPFQDSSFDFIIVSNVIHHLATPAKFFRECSRVLKKGGRLIIQDIYGSLLMRALLRVMRHEGYSFDVDVFADDVICNDPRDPWSANCLIPRMLFDSDHAFQQHFTFDVIHKGFTECVIFPLSGGVIAKTPTINLPRSILLMIDILDRLLIIASKDTLALQIQVVAKNTK